MLSELSKLPSRLEVGKEALPISVWWPGLAPAPDAAGGRQDAVSNTLCAPHPHLRVSFQSSSPGTQHFSVGEKDGDQAFPQGTWPWCGSGEEPGKW